MFVENSQISIIEGRGGGKGGGGIEGRGIGSSGYKCH